MYLLLKILDFCCIICEVCASLVIMTVFTFSLLLMKWIWSRCTVFLYAFLVNFPQLFLHQLSLFLPCRLSFPFILSRLVLSYAVYFFISLLHFCLLMHLKFLSFISHFALTYSFILSLTWIFLADSCHLHFLFTHKMMYFSHHLGHVRWRLCFFLCSLSSATTGVGR